MDKNKKFLLAVIITLILLSATVYGLEQYDIQNITGFDFANIFINDELSLEKGQGFNREADNMYIPSTLNWNGTTYVPLKLLSELLGAEVSWNGSILIDLDQADTESNFSYRQLSTLSMPYTTSMTFDISGAKTAYIEDQKGQIINDLELTINDTSITVENAYMLGLKETFKMIVIKEGLLIEQPFNIAGITLNSFIRMNDQWMTIVPADPSSGFYHPMTIGFKVETGYIETDLKRLSDTLIVEGSNEGVSFNNKESYKKQIERVAYELSTQIASRNKFPFMVSMFPRPSQDTFLYSHALDRDTLFYSKADFDALDRGNLYRIDKQFVAMIDYTQELFESLGLKLEEKVAIAGFSASSDFANRMNMLHQDQFKYVIANLTATMPMTSYKNQTLVYPLGLSNVSTITGKSFDPEKYATVPQFWFVGADDLGDGTRYDDGWGNYGDHSNEWNQEGIDYRKIFGEDSIQRRTLQMTILEDLGYSKIEYIAYPNLAHDWGDTVLKDIDVFIKQND